MPEERFGGRQRPVRILVVGDNADGAELLGVLPRSEGHEVMTIGDGPTALEVARNLGPAVVLLDSQGRAR